MAGPGTGQMTFEGKEIDGVVISLPGIGSMLDYDPPKGTDKHLAQGDRVRVTVEYVIEDVRFPEKYDSGGANTDKMKRHHVARTIVPDTVEIAAVLRREDIQRAWDEQHGATG